MSVNPDDYLFSSRDLRMLFEHQNTEIKKEIDALPSERVLNTSPDDWVAYFSGKAEIEPPQLDETGISLEQDEAKVDVSHDPGRLIFDRSRPFYLPGTAITFCIPFSGEPELFRFRPSTYSMNPRQAAVRGNELRLRYVRLDHNAEAVRAEFERDLGTIKQHLEWMAKDVAPFNASIAGLVSQQIQARRDKLIKDRDLAASLGYPVRRREDAPATYATPAVRRKPPVTRTPSSRAVKKPEPALPMEEYEHILSVVTNMVTVMERSPRAFAGMKEEDLRQHFLVQLNGQYEGQATGETFNFEGKTDILIRVEGRNIFIAECKFWDGPESLIHAIGQLVRYASWRDTKTAILIFNRKKNLSSLLSKIPDTVKAHPSYLRTVSVAETRFRFVLHHRDDPDRELILTTLVFEIPA